MCCLSGCGGQQPIQELHFHASRFSLSPHWQTKPQDYLNPSTWDSNSVVSAENNWLGPGGDSSHSQCFTLGLGLGVSMQIIWSIIVFSFCNQFFFLYLWWSTLILFWRILSSKTMCRFKINIYWHFTWPHACYECNGTWWYRILLWLEVEVCSCENHNNWK